MSAQFGTWIGSNAPGTWKPQIDPALVDDPHFPIHRPNSTAEDA